MKIVVAIHGILTNQTNASWPDKFDVWMYDKDPSIKVIKKEYSAGPFPFWNVWVMDPYFARGLTNELSLFFEEGKPYPELWFVCHSNGAVITMMTVRNLLKRNLPVSGVIMTGAAVENDVKHNGLLEMTSESERATLGRAIAFSSDCDLVLASWLIWPYGRLGHYGFEYHDQPYEDDKIRTEWFPGYGHGDYFNKQNREDTFEQFYKEITK